MRRPRATRTTCGRGTSCPGRADVSRWCATRQPVASAVRSAGLGRSLRGRSVLPSAPCSQTFTGCVAPRRHNREHPTDAPGLWGQGPRSCWRWRLSGYGARSATICTLGMSDRNSPGHCWPPDEPAGLAPLVDLAVGDGLHDRSVQVDHTAERVEAPPDRELFDAVEHVEARSFDPFPQAAACVRLARREPRRPARARLSRTR